MNQLKIIPTAISEVKRFKLRLFQDERGFFMESYNKRLLQQEMGIEAEFVQDNHSRSIAGVLRGLHYQLEKPQGKLIRVLSGVIYDVAVDLRRSSSTFGQWVGVYLSAEEPELFWIPEGFAHGFLAITPVAEVMYKTTDYYDPPSERSIRWDDPELKIDWPLDQAPLQSPKDAQAKFLKEVDLFP